MRRSTLVIGVAVVLTAAGGIALWAISVPRTVTPRLIEWVTTVGELEVTIVDPQGFAHGVRAGEATDLLTDEVDVAVANPSGDQRQLAVQWRSLHCDTQPRITLTADPGVVRLTLDRDIGELEVCDLLPAIRNITLDLRT